MISTLPERVREPGEDDDSPAAATASPVHQAQFVPFTGSEVPPFPLEALPDGVARYAEAVGAHLQVPVDGPALMALAVLSAACAKRIRIRRVADGYEQPLNLY